MKAVVFHGIGDIRLDDVPEPRLEQPTDAICLQAEYARIPFAATGLVKLPGIIDDDKAILLSDIFPTAYFGADLAEIEAGDTVAIFGCGPVGQMAQRQGAEAIDFNKEDPVEALKRLTGGIGPDRAIDAVSVDALAPSGGPAARKHRAYLPHLVDLVASGVVDPSTILTHTEALADAIEAYKSFDRRESGWVKVELKPASAQRKVA